MSRLYFHSLSGEAELLGSEYYHLRGLVYDLAVGMLHLNGLSEDTDRLFSLVPQENLLKGATRSSWNALFVALFRTDHGGYQPLLKYQGRALNCFTLALNTAMVLGNDAVRLAARMAGQADIHGWVDGPNRAWLADIMEEGVDTGIYRDTLRSWGDRDKQWAQSQPLGWREVIALLRRRDDEPVVMSYSVTNGFPDRDITGWMDTAPDGVSEDSHGDAWYDLPKSEQWRLSMDALRGTETGLRELHPDSWDMRFGDGLSVLDLVSQDWEARIREAFGMAELAGPA